MALTSVVNYDTAGNFTFDSSKVEFSGSPTRAKLIQQSAAVAENQPFTSDTGFTYDNTEVEFTAGVARQIDPGITFAHHFAALDASWGDGTLTHTVIGATPSVSSNRLIGDQSDIRGIKFPTASNFANTDVGAIRFIVRPNYSGTPAAVRMFFDIGNATNTVNRIRVLHNSAGGVIQATVYASSGAVIAEVNQAWSPTAGQEYEFELNWDVTAGATRLFIDGTQFGTTQVGTGTRTLASLTNIWLNTNRVETSTSNQDLGSFAIFSAVQHTANYTPGAEINAFKYQGSNVDLPAFTPTVSYTGFTSLATTDAGSPRYTVNVDSGGFQYWNGASWVASDGTFAQANTEADFSTNISSHPSANGATSIVMRVHFQDSVSTQSNIDDLTFNATELGNYPTDNPTVLQNSGVLTDDLESFTETTAVVAGSDDIRYIMVVDDVDMYWTGSAWATSDGTYAQANTPADVNTNALSLFTTAIGGTLKIKAFLHSDSGSTTPELETVTFNYNFYNTQANPTTCTIWGFYRDVAGNGS